MSSLASLLALGLALSSGVAAAAAAPGYGYGQAYNSWQTPPKTWLDCDPVSIPCPCSEYGDTILGCFPDGDAIEGAKWACAMLCLEKKLKQWETWGTWRPASEPGTGTPATGTIEAVGPGVFQGHLPTKAEPIGPTSDWKGLTHEVAVATGNPSLKLAGPAEFFAWADSVPDASYAELHWKDKGPPEPRSKCAYAATVECSCQGLLKGDTITACSEVSEADARLLALTTCSQLCYEARRQTWENWGTFKVPSEGDMQFAPIATIEAVKPGVFQGHVPSQLEVIGPTSDWEGLSVTLAKLSGSPVMWLSGPAEFYVSAAASCGEAERMAYLSDVTNGVPESELEAKYGHCRPQTDALLATTNYNISYERMNSCGWHPQARLAACDVEIRQNTGYNAYPSGSTEHALFCLDCNMDGIYEFATPGSVHVTNNVSGTGPTWHHLIYGNTANARLCTPGDGRAFNVRVIMSWASRPTSCNYRPIWGNQIDFRARRDP